MNKPKLSFSIGDLPLSMSLDELFSTSKDMDVDGVEVMIGVKSRLNLRMLEKLSQKYHVPVLSIHAPPWMWMGYVYDEETVKVASHLNAKYNAHPIFMQTIHSNASKKLYAWLMKMKSKYRVEILIENMPDKFKKPILEKFLRTDPSCYDLAKLHNVYKTYGFGMTLDISHLEKPDPRDFSGYDGVEKYIQNIHLSDFTMTEQHLQIGEGILKTKEYIDHLKKIKYEGIITLELNDKLFSDKKEYIKGVAQSVKIIKNYLYGN